MKVLGDPFHNPGDDCYWMGSSSRSICVCVSWELEKCSSCLDIILLVSWCSLPKSILSGGFLGVLHSPWTIETIRSRIKHGLVDQCFVAIKTKRVLIAVLLLLAQYLMVLMVSCCFMMFHPDENLITQLTLVSSHRHHEQPTNSCIYDHHIYIYRYESIYIYTSPEADRKMPPWDYPILSHPWCFFNASMAIATLISLGLSWPLSKQPPFGGGWCEPFEWLVIRMKGTTSELLVHRGDIHHVMIIYLDEIVSIHTQFIVPSYEIIWNHYCCCDFKKAYDTNL